MNKEIFKQISIRGRFAFGIICLENLLAYFNIESQLLKTIVQNHWRFTNLEKLGELEDYFTTIKPWCILSDYPKLKVNPEKMHEFGYDHITLEEMKSTYDLYCTLPKDVTGILSELSTIANANISAGCGEYSHLTFQPTVKILEIMGSYPVNIIPEPKMFLFSSFKENNGWGEKFTKEQIFPVH
jgi:hypothetical protein